MRVGVGVGAQVLSHLDLHNNRIVNVPDTIGQLTRLTYLNLGSNNLEVLPSAVGNLTNLTTLALYRNKLSILPLTVGRLSNLTDLDLVDNHTRSPPIETAACGTKAVISFFANLLHARASRRLELSGLGLETLPMELEYITYLTELNLSGNQLRSCRTW